MSTCVNWFVIDHIWWFRCVETWLHWWWCYFDVAMHCYWIAPIPFPYDFEHVSPIRQASQSTYRTNHNATQLYSPIVLSTEEKSPKRKEREDDTYS